MLPRLQRFWDLVCRDLNPGQRAGRLKQWLNLMRRRYPEAEEAFQTVRVMTNQQVVGDWIRAQHARHGVDWALSDPASLPHVVDR